MWQTECIVCTVNTDVANKIIIKMPHQPLILKKEKKLKSKKYMNLDLSSSSTRTLKNTNLDLNIRTCA